MVLSILQEAISKAEEAQYKEAARVLRAACPLAAPNSVEDKNWLQTFADNLNKEFQKREAEKLQLVKTLEFEKSFKVTAQPPTSRLDELQSEKEYLQGLVDKYKKVIDETVSLPGNYRFKYDY